MASNPSTFLGMEAMNNNFMAGNIIGGSGMMSADVTPFHPSMLLEHGSSLGFGILGGAAVTVAELGTQFAATKAMPPQQQEMDCGFDGVGGGDRCSAASLQQCPGQSCGMTVWSSSSKAPYGCWSGVFDTAGFQYPVLAYGGGVPNAPATSELSLTLCSKSSSDSALHAATDKCSSVASRSALTELPQARSTPAPFALVVARPRYAAAAQEALNDIVGRLLDGVVDVDAVDSGSGATPLSRSVDASSSVVSSNRLMIASSEDGGAHAQRVRSDLISTLHMLDHKYNQCLDELQSTTAMFNGLIQLGEGNARVCAPFAHRAVAAMYRGLRRRIASEIMAAASRPTCWGESSSATGGYAERSWESALIQKHWAAQKVRRGERQCWRPQRGLPERSVAVLKAWMFEHFLKPYPDDHQKEVLAARSGLTRNQVSNWFINARVRIWKPMIEEMYKEEFGAEMDSHSSSENAGGNNKGKDEAISSEDHDEFQSPSSAAKHHHLNTFKSEVNAMGSMDAAGQLSGLDGAMGAYATSLNLSHHQSANGNSSSLLQDAFAHHHHGGGDAARFVSYGDMAGHLGGYDGSGGGSVSLTLGLQHCNDGGGAVPGAAEQQGLLYGNAGDFVEFMNGGGEDRQRFGSTQLLHDFVA